ncbi:MAG TPA: hypothetical protein VL981_12080 [Candidatus Methylacidiphilales bacterium]|nr:hypothetical protein [Candidatus Methylacidiphilales bacterium]
MRFLFLLTFLTLASISSRAVDLTQADIGKPQMPGSGASDKDGTTLVAGGKDVWGTSDQFRFAYLQRKGNFDAQVHILSLQPAQLYSRAGLMVREDLTNTSRHLFFVVFSDNQARHNNNGGYELQFRDTAGGKSGGVYPAITPGAPPQFPVNYPNVWLRVVRQGNTLTCFASPDGKNWSKYGEHTSEFPAQVYLGVALTAHNPTATATAKFSGFSVKP